MTLRVPTGEEGLASAELWALGTLGLEVIESGTDSLLIAYFERGRAAAEGWDQGSNLPAHGRLERLETLEERDWLETYRSSAQPFPLGRGFWVDPGDSDQGFVGETRPAAPLGRRALKLPARRAFGTGTHETTRLAVELLEARDLQGRSVLDVGVGSGILSFVATALGASVVGVEIDPIAALLAAQNQVSNGLDFGLLAGRIACLRPQRRFDLAVVNVIPERIAGDLPDIVSRLGEHGQMIVSGFLNEHAEQYRRDLEQLGLKVLETRSLDEWSAFLLRRDDGAVSL